MNRRLVFLSVVPSPYQRDGFSALARRGRIDLQVYYLERAAPDSPWPDAPLQPWETVLRGVTLGRGRWRSHFNWNVPAPEANETWIVNGSMTDITTQRLMRRLSGKVPWCFWGEVPSAADSPLKSRLQSLQYAPLRGAAVIIAVGERAREVYQRLVPGLPVFNQPYTCSLEAFATAAEDKKPNAEPVFLFCGQMIARKGIDVLLQAFERLVTSGVRARLSLVGREAELPALLAGLPPATRDRILYHGFQPPAALPHWFAQADVFVLPSRHDGWGVVVNQAFGARLPVICSRAVGAGLDLIRDGANGLMVEPGDVDSLAAAMRELAESPEKRERFSSAAATTAAHLTPEHAAEFWEGIVSEITSPL